MGVKVTVGSGNTANITGYSVQEDSTPLNPADSTGGVGQITVTVPEGSIDGSWHDTTAITRANLVSNPSFEVNTTGWASNLAGAVLTRIGTDQKYGAYCAQLVCDGTAALQAAYTTTRPVVRKNNVYTASAWVKATAGKSVRIELGEWNSSDVLVGTRTLGPTIQATGAWQRITISRKMGSTAAKADIVIRNIDATTNTILIDGVQLEASAKFTDYFDGNSQQVGELNYYWTGTAGNSVSVERDGIIAVNNVLNPSMETANTPDTLLRTNLVTNPSFANNVTGWTSDNVDAEISYSSNVGANGRRGYARVVDTSYLGTITSPNIPVPAGVSIFEFSFYSKAESGTTVIAVGVQIFDNTDSVISGNEIGALSADWTRNAFSIDLGGVTGSGYYAQIYVRADPVASYIDDMMLEANTGSVSTYFDGDITDTADIIYSWSGDSNNSTSLMKTRKVIVRQNLDVNPSFETPGATGGFSNQSLNPSMEYANDAARSYTQRNFFMNPSFEINSGTSSEVDRNACYNPGLRVDGTGWATVSSVITTNGGGRVVGNFASVGTVGFWRATATNAATGYIDARYGSASTTYVQVTAGVSYTASVYMRASYVSTSTAIYILWYTAAGALISQPNIVDATSLAANTYRRMSLTMTAPATAARAIIIARCSGTSVVGSTMDGGGFMMENAGTASTTALAGNPGQYFDGSFAASGDFTYSWTGTVNASISYRNALLIPNQGDANQANGWQSSLYSSIGTKTLAVKASDTTLSGYVSYSFPSGIGVANQIFTAKVTARSATGSFNLAYPVTIYEDGGSNRLLGTIIPTGTTLTTTPTEYTVTFTAPADVNANLRMLFRGGPAISQVVHYDKAFLTQGDYSGNYFDGSNSTGLDAELSTAWEGTANNSVSNIGGIRPDAILSGNSTLIQSSLWSNNGTKSVRIIATPVTSATNNTFAYLNSTNLLADGSLAVGSGLFNTFVGTVRLTEAQTNPLVDRARRAVLVIVRPSGTEVSMLGTQPPNAAGVYEIRGTFTVPDDATSVQIRLYNGDSYNGADVWWDSVGLFFGKYYGPYFDGNTTDTSELTYAWDTPGSASVSRISYTIPATWDDYTGTFANDMAYRTQEQVLSGTYSMKCLLSGISSTVYNHNFFDLVENTNYTVSVYVKGTAGRQVYISANTQLGSFANSSIFTLTGGWDRVTLTFNSGTEPFIWGISISNGDYVEDQNIFYVDQVLIEEAEEVGTWFSGSTTDVGDFTYDWTGVANYSQSIQVSPTVANYTASNCRAIHSGDWAALGTKSLRITPVNDSVDSYVYPSTSLSEYAGKRVTVLGTSRLTAAQAAGFDASVARRIVAFVYSPTMGNNTYRSTQAPNAAGVTNHTLTFDIPADVTYLSIRLYNGADEFGGDVWWDKFAIIEVPAGAEWLEGYFDGSSSDYDYNNYVWTGTANASTSEKRVRTQETDYSLFLNDVIDLEDGAQGTTRGTVNSVNNADGMLALAGDSRLAVFIAERSVQPYPLPSGTYSTGTLGNAFAYYLSLVGITTGFSVDSTIASNPFKAQGWYGDMWAAMKQLCAAQRVEIALVSDNIVLRPVRTRIAENFRDISRSSSLQNTQLAERVEVYQYNNVTLNNAVVYPMPVWEWNSSTKSYGFVYGTLDSNPQVYQVNADETITVEIPINTSISSGTIKQPYAVDTIPLTNSKYVGVDSIYAIIDKEGKPYPAAQWNAGKGSISVKVLEDTKTLQVKIKGAKDVDRGPFRIARASADTTYAALYIVADGILANKELKTFYTGAPIAKVGQEIGITIDNPFIDNTSEAYTALAIASAKYAHPQQTISVQTVGINRTDTSQNFRYPTFDEFAAAQGVKTFAQFETDEAGATFAQYDAEWKTETIDTFENQAFGNVNGARVLYGAAWYRIRSATLNESTVSYSAEVDTTIEDFNDDNPYLTFKEFNTRFAGKKFEDYALIPLWQS